MISQKKHFVALILKSKNFQWKNLFMPNSFTIFSFGFTNSVATIIILGNQFRRGHIIFSRIIFLTYTGFARVLILKVTHNLGAEK